MPKNVKFTTPQLPAAPREYEQSRFEKILNSLRLYFSQLDNHLRSKEFELESNSMEITSLDTGDKEKPIISLFRNSSSPANSDKLGAIRWFGQADSGEKKLFGQIYTKAADIGDASEQGEMVFTIAADNGLAGSVANAVTDITADLANDLDPAFTITQNEVKIPGTNNFMIEDAGNGGAVQFKESGGNIGAINFVDITGNRAVQFPDASGTVITTGNLSGITSVGTLAQDTLEITSTDAGAGEKPNVSLYRNSSSPAASDEMGSIDFYGNDSAGNKTLYGQIYTEASVVTNGSEQAHLNFAVASGSSGFEDPVVRMRKYALEVLPNNTLDLHQNSFIKFEGSTNDANETSLKAANPTADREITLPDATGTVVLNESGIVEIEVQVGLDMGTSFGTFVYFSLSDNESYNALQTYYEQKVADPDENDDIGLLHKWVVPSLTPGTTYTYWLGAKVLSATGTPKLEVGGNAGSRFRDFIMKATALPSNTEIET